MSALGQKRTFEIASVMSALHPKTDIRLMIVLIMSPPLSSSHLLLSVAGFGQLIPAYIGGLFWSSAMKEGAIASLVLGTGAFFLFEFAVSPFVGLHPGVLGMMTGTLALVLVSKTTARRVGSNLQPPDSKSGALSVELRVRPTRVTRSMARRPGASGCPSESHKTDRSGT